MEKFRFYNLTNDRLQNLHFNNALVAFIPIFGFYICFKINNCGKIFMLLAVSDGCFYILVVILS